MAKISNPLEIFRAKICVKIITDATKININSKEKYPKLEIIMKNQKDEPAVTANDLNLGDDVCILYRINECHKTGLC